MKYIVIEGPDCAGTTTQRDLLGKYLQSKGCKVVLEHEPGHDREHGGKVHDYLHGRIRAGMREVAEWYAIDRLELLEKLRKLDADTIIISDRNYFSSFVYQVLKGIPEDKVSEMNREFINNKLRADVYLILRVERDELKRRLEEKKGKDVFENDYEFQKKTWERYNGIDGIIRKYYPEEAEKIFFVNGTQKPELVLGSIIKILELKQVI